MTPALPHTYLFVPADRPERFDKACAAGAHRVIADLEDAVAPAAKTGARAALAAWLDAARPVAVRINAAGTEGFADDLALCRHPAVVAVMLPKAETVGVLRELAARLPGKPLLPLVETARGLANARSLAAAPGVQRLVFGTVDFQADLGIGGDGDELLFFRSELVLASRLAGVAAPVDGVGLALDDPQTLRAASLRARCLGFGAKLCIHPMQVAVVNEAFAPSAVELAWARRVVEAVERSQGAAVALDGQMVDRPVLLRAQAMLARH